MVKIVYDGMCEGCECADLRLEYCSAINKSESEKWTLICTHKFACEQMEDKMIKKYLYEKGLG